MSKKQTFVKVPYLDGEIELEYLTGNIEEARSISNNWELKLWKSKSQPALMNKSGGFAQLYHGQTFDPMYFSLGEHTLTHDHCLICWKTITDWKDSEEPVDNEGYSDGDNWICKNCYTNFVKPEDYKTVLDNLERVNKE